MREARNERREPLVSIIIPVYNKADFVRESLESALAQTYPNIELVLVNDGSTDSSLAILEEYRSKFPEKIMLIDQENGGVSKATNVGIRASKGAFIQFLDADDLLSPDKIENQVRILEGNSPFALASCEWVNFKNDISQFIRLPYGVFQNYETGLDWLLYSWNKQEMMADSSWLTSKALLNLAGQWDESLSINQDGEFFMRVLLKSEKVIFDPKSKAYYRTLNETSVSKQQSYLAAQSLLDSFRKYQNEILNVEDSKRVRLALKRVYMKFIYDVYPMYPNLIKKAKDLMWKLDINEKVFIAGPKFQKLSRFIGFENALRLKRILQ
ncbi:glycosyltransferase family 2 protein [Cyclobacterium jeungdonense]|uniref:Glycosyltransferase n=1 Tax=Cyclobacterium jeungdonense TaxID=708087 RepID=A0ABT8CCQ9_9BACT|nr:glycosyltransferase family 2 protein [Cyclobacterium jeungdonense]MDN3690578.1 glycosyltransferase [Cyclobacterium jeungdonense]